MNYLFLKQDNREMILKKLGIFLREAYANPEHVFLIEDVMGAVKTFLEHPPFVELYYKPDSVVTLSLKVGAEHSDEIDAKLFMAGHAAGEPDLYRYVPWAILLQPSKENPEGGLLTSRITNTSIEERKRYTAPFSTSLQ